MWMKVNRDLHRYNLLWESLTVNEDSYCKGTLDRILICVFGTGHRILTIFVSCVDVET